MSQPRVPNQRAVIDRRALAGETITVFGDGRQERDCLYVDDVVECLLLAALAPEAPGQLFNVGNDEHLELRTIAQAIVAAAGSGRSSCGGSAAA